MIRNFPNLGVLGISNHIILITTITGKSVLSTRRPNVSGCDSIFKLRDMAFVLCLQGLHMSPENILPQTGWGFEPQHSVDWYRSHLPPSSTSGLGTYVKNNIQASWIYKTCGSMMINTGMSTSHNNFWSVSSPDSLNTYAFTMEWSWIIFFLMASATGNWFHGSRLEENPDTQLLVTCTLPFSPQVSTPRSICSDLGLSLWVLVPWGICPARLLAIL